MTLSGLVGIGLEHPGQLASRGGKDASNTGRRGLDKTHQLTTDLIEGRQGRKGANRLFIQNRRLAEQAANNGVLVVLLGVLHDNLGRRHRVCT